MKMRLVVIRDGEGTDVSYLMQNVKWGGQSGSAARSMTAELLDDDSPGHDRISIDLLRGDQCMLFHVDDHGKVTEVFRGIIMSIDQGISKTLSFTAYDLGIYLANNKDTFVYSGKTASDIFRDVCGRFGIPVGQAVGTPYAIPEMTASKTTGWDAIADALEQTYENTGIRYAVTVQEGKVNLLERRKSVLQYLLEPNSNLMEYASSCSIEKIKTRIKAYDKEDTVVAEASNAGLESRIGIFQDIETADDEMTEAQVNAKIQASLAELSKPEKTLEVTCLGVPDVLAGVGVYVRIEHLDLEASYYVERDQHSWDGNVYQMQLSLTQAEDTTTELPQEKPSEFSVGDTVNFGGGQVYVSSDASSAAGTRSAGTATITHVAKGAPHPYHLEGSTVYGWVDAGAVS